MFSAILNLKQGDAGRPGNGQTGMFRTPGGAAHLLSSWPQPQTAPWRSSVVKALKETEADFKASHMDVISHVGYK